MTADSGHQIPSLPDGGSRSPGRPSSMVTPSGLSRETWLQTRLRGGAGRKFKDAADSMLAWFSGTDEPNRVRRAAFVEHIHAMLDELERWKDAYFSERTARDRAVREALSRPDCEIHDAELTELRQRVKLLEADRDRAEAGRLALVDGLFRLDQAIDAWEVKKLLAKDAPDLITLVRQMSTRAHQAHRRAWRS